MIVTPKQAYDTVELEKIRVGMVQHFNREMLHAMAGGLTVKFCPAIGEQIAVQFVSYVWGMRSERICIHRRWPKTWWDAFKARWFPARLLDHFPAEYDHVDVDRQLYAAVCPHLRVPEHRSHVSFLASHREPRTPNPEP